MAAEEPRSRAVGRAAAAGEDGPEAERAAAWGEQQELGDPQTDPKAAGHQSAMDHVHPKEPRAKGHKGDEEKSEEPLEQEKRRRRPEGGQASTVVESGHRSEMARGKTPLAPRHLNSSTAGRAPSFPESHTDSCKICTQRRTAGDGMLRDRGIAEVPVMVSAWETVCPGTVMRPPLQVQHLHDPPVN